VSRPVDDDFQLPWFGKFGLVSNSAQKSGVVCLPHPRFPTSHILKSPLVPASPFPCAATSPRLRVPMSPRSRVPESPRPHLPTSPRPRVPRPQVPASSCPKSPSPMSQSPVPVPLLVTAPASRKIEGEQVEGFVSAIESFIPVALSRVLPREELSRVLQSRANKESIYSTRAKMLNG